MLEEMEKIVVVTFRKNDTQVSAEFSLVSHIGSFVPRFLYSPIEEVSFNLFGKLTAEKQEADDEEGEIFIGDNEKRDFVSPLQLQCVYLYRILKIMNAIGVAFLLAGTTLSNGWLIYIYGHQWGSYSCVITMQTYCIYEWLMGLNGITESFVNGSL